MRILARAFTRFAAGTAWLAGHYVTSVLAIAIVAAWAVAGPFVDCGRATDLPLSG